MELADKLLQLRKEQGWTQAKAAKEIDIQQSYLSKLENGHYIPSPDVLLKLCKAYNVVTEDLLPLPRKSPKWFVLAYFCSITAIALILSGYFALFFPQTYYTYEISALEKLEAPKNHLKFQFIDTYLGEKYIKKLSGIDYKFELIAQREIPRKENRWLIVVGLLVLLVSVSWLLFSYLGLKRYVLRLTSSSSES